MHFKVQYFSSKKILGFGLFLLNDRNLELHPSDLGCGGFSLC